MDLAAYVDTLQRHLAAATEGAGEEARAVTERLAVPMEAAIRLTVQEAVAAAAEEISCELAPGAVEVRLRGRDLEFVVAPPPADVAADTTPADAGAAARVENDDGSSTARINLRLPDQLKTRVEQAAAREGLSVNSWLVRAAAAALDRAGSGHRRAVHSPQRFTGWAR